MWHMHGRTKEEFIQGRTGAIIDASRQNSIIQGSTVHLDDSSARLDAHFTSRVGRARERGRETKTPSMSTRDQVRRPIVDNSSSAAKLASYLRWAPPKVQVETWECWVVTSRLAVSETVHLAGGCELMVHKPSPERFPEPPGPGEHFRMALGWTPLPRTQNSGSLGLSGGSAGGSSF